MEQYFVGLLHQQLLYALQGHALIMELHKQLVHLTQQIVHGVQQQLFVTPKLPLAVVTLFLQPLLQIFLKLNIAHQL